MVSVLSMVFMGVSAVVSIGLSIGLFVILRKKYALKIVPALVGAAAFIVFAMVLEQIMHAFVLQPDADGTIALMNKPILFILYGIFAAGIFEETARFLSFLLLKRKYNGIGTGLSYGIGHGGIEAIILVGLSMISNLIVSFMINAGAADVLGPQAVAALTDTDSFLFLVSCLERILAISIQIALSVLVWLSVYRKNKRWLFPAAIIGHAMMDVPAAMMQAGMLKSIFVVEGITVLLAIALVTAVILIYKNFKQKDAHAPASEAVSDV